MGRGQIPRRRKKQNKIAIYSPFSPDLVRALLRDGGPHSLVQARHPLGLKNGPYTLHEGGVGLDGLRLDGLDRRYGEDGLEHSRAEPCRELLQRVELLVVLAREELFCWNRFCKIIKSVLSFLFNQFFCCWHFRASCHAREGTGR